MNLLFNAKRGMHICHFSPLEKFIDRNKLTQNLLSRLLYQSRKRGMLENDLLLSTFADKHLHLLTPELVDQYDKLINEPSNDWDLFYWLTGKQEPPVEFKNQVFDMLKDHTQNKHREVRCRQPSLRF